MSRIGKQPVAIPGGVKIQIAEGKVRVEGPKGKLEFAPHAAMKVIRATTTRPRPSSSPGPTMNGSTAPCTG